jgi:hypothetical protein
MDFFGSVHIGTYKYEMINIAFCQHTHDTEARKRVQVADITNLRVDFRISVL